jgi:hypothetical protein
MEKLFNINIHFVDGSTNDYYIIATDDVSARAKVLRLEAKSWKDFGTPKDAPDVEYCEIKMISGVDG